MSVFELIPTAHAAVDMTAFGSAVNPILKGIVYPVVELMFGVALLVFVYGVLRMVLNGSDEEARSSGKLSILWGSIGMFIMVSAWGIIYLISNTVGGAFK